MKYVNPINQKIEKRKFFSKENYDPIFKYKKLDFDSILFKEKLSECKKNLGNEKISILFSKKIDKIIDWILLLENVKKKDFTKYSKKYFSYSNKELVLKAKKILKTVKSFKKEEKDISSFEAVKYLNKKQKEMSLNWKVKENSNLGARCYCSLVEKTLYLKNGELFSMKDLKRLTVHELSVYALRVINSEKLDYHLFECGTAEYEALEEGLAATFEKRNILLDMNTFRNYAGRVLAVNLSLKKSFSEVYNCLLKFFSEEDSYKLVLRVKRGLKETNESGGFIKDYIYLQGMEELKNIKDLNELLKARIALEDLPILKKLKII